MPGFMDKHIREMARQDPQNRDHYERLRRGARKMLSTDRGDGDTHLTE